MLPLFPVLQSFVSLGLVVSASRLFWPPPQPARGRAASGGGNGGDIPPSPLPPVRPPVLAWPGAVAELQVVAGALAVSIQVILLLLKTDVSRVKEPREAADMAACVLVLLIPGVLLPAWVPHFFERRQRAIMVLMRLCYFSLPSMRSPKAILHVFQGKPSQGRCANVSDYWHLFVGLHGISLSLSPFVMPLPVLPHILLSAFALQRCRATALMCSLPLLRHPTWLRRISWVHLTAEVLPLTSTYQRTKRPLAAAAAGGGPPGTAPADQCHVFLTFCQLLLVTVSVVLASRLQPLLLAASPAVVTAAAPAAGAVQAARQDTIGSADTHAPRWDDAAPPQAASRRYAAGINSGWRWLSSSAHHCAAWLRGVAVETEAAIHHLSLLLSGTSGVWVVRLCIWWLLLSLLWGLALVLEHPAPFTGAGAAT